MAELKKKYVKDIIWSSIGIFSLGLSAFILNLLVGNISGVSDLGIIMLSYLLYHNLPLTLFSFGLDPAVTKLVAEYYDSRTRRRMIFNTAITMALVFSIISFIILYLLSETIAIKYFRNINYKYLLRYFSLACSIAILNKPVLGYLNGNQDLRARSLIETGRSILFICLTLFLLLYKYNVAVVPCSLLLSEFIFLVIGIIKTKPSLILLDNWKEFAKYSKSLFILGFPISFSSVMSRIGTRIDIIMIGFFIDTAAIGVYSFVLFIHEGTSMLTAAMQKVNIPFVTKLFYSKDNRLQEFIDISINYSQILYSLIGVLIFSLAWEIPQLLYPGREEFINGIIPLKIFVVFMIVAGSISGLNGSESLCVGKSYINFYLVIAYLASNVILNYILIPVFSLSGAASATLVSYSIIFIMSAYFRWKNLKVSFNWRKYLKNIILIIGVYSLVIYGTDKINHYILGILGVLLLLTFYLITGGIRKQEIDYLKGFFLKK